MKVKFVATPAQIKNDENVKKYLSEGLGLFQKYTVKEELPNGFFLFTEAPTLWGEHLPYNSRYFVSVN